MIGPLTRFDEVGGGHYRGAFDSSWNQGPGAYGGLLAATLGQCAERRVEGRQVRALSMHLCAPAEPGPLDVRLVVEREGTAVSFLSARIEQAGRAVVLATATLAKGRVADADFDHAEAPILPPPEACREFPPMPGVPVFTQHFRFCFAEGVPFTGQPRAVTSGWVGFREDAPLSTPTALALLDCWPLAILPTLDRPRPAASVAIHFQLFPPHTGSGPLYKSRVTSDLNREGYSDQENAIWDASGRLIGRSHQLVALIR